MNKLTEEQKKKNKYKKQVQAYIEVVTNFVTDKNHGTFPMEFSLSIELLKQYYTQFLILCDEIDNLDSIIVDTRYGKQPNALLKARDATVTKLNEILRSLGCTFYTQTTMKLSTTYPKEESALEAFVSKAEKKKKEYR